jgi:PDZ domain-containing secreted protein
VDEQTSTAAYSDTPAEQRGRRQKRAYIVAVLTLVTCTSAAWRWGTSPADFGQASRVQIDMTYRGETRGQLLILSHAQRLAEKPDEILAVLATGSFTTTQASLFDYYVEGATGANSDRGGANAQEIAGDAAWAAANTMLGTPVAIVPMVMVTNGNGELRPGDSILSVDGVSLWSDGVRRRLERGGDSIEIGHNGNIRTISAAAIDPHKIGLWDAARIEATRPGVLHVNNSGGPSSGLIVALAYLDALGDGDLTGGLTVAGTGMISPDGTVGTIGSMTYKAHAAVHAGADILFVPEANEQEAVRAVDGAIEVVAVDTLYDAVSWLCQHGGRTPAC